MGRHRRSDAGRAATGRAAGTPEEQHSEGWYTEQYGEPYGVDHAGAHEEQTFSYPSHSAHSAYASAPSYAPAPAPVAPTSSYAPTSPYAPQDETVTAVYGSVSSAGGSDDPPRGHAHRRRKKRDGVPLRTGLLGASACVAMGAVAVASGLIPGGDTFKLGGDHGGNKVQAADSPSVEAQGGTDGTVEDRASQSAASRDDQRSASPSASPSKSTESAEPSAKPSKTPAESKTSASDSGTKTKSASPATTAPVKKTSAPAAGGSTTTTSDEAAAAAQVLTLVNQERAKVGCSPVTADSDLASLASAFSEDMAARNFFDHTDPDGATPWDRAKKVGITNLGGENIARGQANAQSVMDAWMNSEGHKANILNCDFKTLGVGVHFGSGGPWWTQDFGY
ncbi:CAP domain-containing protein [Streptomyces sp. NPDC059639]|uniref:CAP domain-containing protein n=1 Tax=Streptomyces sp. NPDC059639 TaxID=3346891 RepID=UPI0036CABC82